MLYKKVFQRERYIVTPILFRPIDSSKEINFIVIYAYYALNSELRVIFLTFLSLIVFFDFRFYKLSLSRLGNRKKNMCMKRMS